MIYWAGKISGGAFNPAVSFALYLNKKLSIMQMSGYIIAQFLGALFAFYFFKIKT
jgi:aquaporin Z